MKTFKQYISTYSFSDKTEFNDLLDELKRKSVIEIEQFFEDEPDFKFYDNRDTIVMATRVHYLCKEVYNINPPMWVLKKKYFSEDPIFPKGVNGMLRAILSIESPVVFKMHGVFVSDNALKRV